MPFQKLLERLWLRLNRSFFFAKKLPGFARQYFYGGLWLCLFPPLGWYMALGFRTQVGYRLLDGSTPVLPGWEDWRQHLANGIRAGGVIQAFYLPYSLTFWFCLGLNQPGLIGEHWPYLATFVVTAVLLPPVGISLLPAIYAWLFPWAALHVAQSFLLAALLFIPTFILPAAFMQVLQARMFRAAFRFHKLLPFITGNFVEYLEAWVVSLASIAVAFTMGPFAPWGLFWTYPTITYAFQSIFQPALLKP